MDDSNTKGSILLIDDEVDLADLTAFQLKAHGYEVRIAHNGVEGLEMLENYDPDLIILDINMPKMGGIEFYENILGYDREPRIPILVLTARANLEELFRQLTVEGFMTKPFEFKDLMEEVDMIMNKKMKRKESNDMETFKKILIIEDDEEAFHVISKSLLQDGHTVTGAPSGGRAFVKFCKDIPDLVVVKMSLSDISGDEVIMKLKLMPRAKNTKFILYFPKGEAYDNSIAHKISEKAGADLYIDTDHPEQLTKEIRGFISK